MAKYQKVGAIGSVATADSANGSSAAAVSGDLSRCIDPYRDDHAQLMDWVGTIAASLNTLIVLVCVCIGVKLALATKRRYTVEALLALSEAEQETAARKQSQREHWIGSGGRVCARPVAGLC